MSLNIQIMEYMTRTYAKSQAVVIWSQIQQIKHTYNKEKGQMI